MLQKSTGYARAKKLYPLAEVLCEACDAPATERHHLDRNPLNNERINLRFLCAPCHVEVHLPRVCPQGHPLSGENLYTSPRGRHGCQLCRRAAEQRYRELHRDRRREGDRLRKAARRLTVATTT